MTKLLKGSRARFANAKQAAGFGVIRSKKCVLSARRVGRGRESVYRKGRRMLLRLRIMARRRMRVDVGSGGCGERCCVFCMRSVLFF